MVVRGQDRHLFDLVMDLSWEAEVDESGGLPPMDGQEAKKPTVYKGTLSYPELASTVELAELEVQVKHGKKTIAAGHKAAVDEAIDALKTTVLAKIEDFTNAYAES